MKAQGAGSLENKVAIVTGGSRGIGKAVALKLAARGAAVVVAARSVEDKPGALPGTIGQTVDQIIRRGGRAMAVACNVIDENSVTAMVQSAYDAYGRIDILVNNAGVAVAKPLCETSLKHWNLVLGVNLTGAFLCSRAVLPVMKARGAGSIVNISSLAADERGPAAVDTGLAYGVAKAGLDRLTHGLAAEVGRFGIAVNAVKPVAVVDTEGMRFWSTPEQRQSWVGPEKMVACVVFLAGQDASGVSGVVATDDEYLAWHGLTLE